MVHCQASILDKLPWQMRTIKFVPRLASASVSNAVSFVNNLMKICEACTVAVYSLRTDTYDLPSLHIHLFWTMMRTLLSLLLLLPLPSLTWLSRQFQVQASANKPVASIDDITHALPPIHLGQTIIRLRDGLLRFATTDTQVLNLIISSLELPICILFHCWSTVDFICRSYWWWFPALCTIHFSLSLEFFFQCGDNVCDILRALLLTKLLLAS